MKPIAAAVVLVFLLTLAAPGSAQQQGGIQQPDFKHPRAVQAWKRLQYRLELAQRTYDRDIAAAKQEYIEGLKEAAHSASRMGNLEEVKLIAEAQTVIPDGHRLLPNPSDLTGTIWGQLQRSGRCSKVQFNADGEAQVSGGRPVRQAWQLDGSIMRLGDDQFVWNGTVFVGVGNSATLSLVPWPWAD